MANDRLRIRCKFCKEDRMLYKYYPRMPAIEGEPAGGGYVTQSEDFSEWMDKHVQECNPVRGFDLGGEVTFELFCENGQ